MTLLFTGTMMGLCASVQSLLRTVGPTVGGFLYVNYGISSIGLIQFVVNVGVFGLLLQRHLTRTAEHQEWNIDLIIMFDFWNNPCVTRWYIECIEVIQWFTWWDMVKNLLLFNNLWWRFRVEPLDGSRSSLLPGDTYIFQGVVCRYWDFMKTSLHVIQY